MTPFWKASSSAVIRSTKTWELLENNEMKTEIIEHFWGRCEGQKPLLK